jgi:hypothetical protein
MAGNPREHVKNKGFWDGGAPGQSSDDQHAGRTSGTPGTRSKRTGIRTDIEFPPDDPAKNPGSRG